MLALNRKAAACAALLIASTCGYLVTRNTGTLLGDEPKTATAAAPGTSERARAARRTWSFRRVSAPQQQADDIVSDPSDTYEGNPVDHAAGILRGDLESTEGEPLSGVFVVAMHTATGKRHRTLAGRGSFVLTDLPAGTYQVWPLRPREAMAGPFAGHDRAIELDVDAGEEAWIALALDDAHEHDPPERLEARTAAIHANVVDAQTGEPVPGIAVMAVPARPGRFDGHPGRGHTDERGFLEILRAPAGSLRLTVVDPAGRYAPLITTVEAAAGADELDLGLIELRPSDEPLG